MNTPRLTLSSARLGDAVILTALGATVLTCVGAFLLSCLLADRLTWAEPVPSFPVRTMHCYTIAVLFSGLVFTFLATVLLVVRRKDVNYVSAAVIGAVTGGCASFGVVVSRPNPLLPALVAFAVPVLAALLAVPTGSLSRARAAA